MRSIFLYIILFVLPFSLIAQDEPQKPNNGHILGFAIGMGVNIPMADLRQRYGTNLNFSLGGDYVNKNNWILNGEFLYLFSENIKEDVLAPFRTNTGVILGDDQQIADVFLRQRGLFLGLGIGKLFPFQSSSRSGIKVLLSGGILQHNIKFVDERNSVAQVRAGRYVGYDRLTRGFSLKETIAYKHLSADKRLNFEFALDFIQGFTSEVRAFNFDTGKPTLASRFDMLIGARIIWNLPFYIGGEETTRYY